MGQRLPPWRRQSHESITEEIILEYTPAMQAERAEYTLSLGDRAPPFSKEPNPLMIPLGKGTPGSPRKQNCGQLKEPPKRKYEPCPCNRGFIRPVNCPCKETFRQSASFEDEEPSVIYFKRITSNAEIFGAYSSGNNTLSPIRMPHRTTRLHLEQHLDTGKWTMRNHYKKHDNPALRTKLSRRIVRNINMNPTHKKWREHMTFERSNLLIELKQTGYKVMTIPVGTGFSWKKELPYGETVINLGNH